MVLQSIKKGKNKKIFAHILEISKHIDYADLKNVYYYNVFERISAIAKQKLLNFIVNC